MTEVVYLLKGLARPPSGYQLNGSLFRFVGLVAHAEVVPEERELFVVE